MRFMLLDDHPMFRDTLRGLLEYLYPDAQFCECGSTAEAKEFLEQQPPDFVIADLELLDTVCFDLIRAIKRKHPGVPVLVLSMHEDSRMINQALEAGADGYVSKREDYTAVKQAIPELLAGKKYLSQTISAALVESIQTPPPPPPAAKLTALLSQREFDVFKMLGRERSRKYIAEKLNVSLPTVNSYIERMKKKLNLDSTTQLVYHAIKYTIDKHGNP